MEKKTILVCGATGFIGRNMVEYFSKNPAYDVIGTYNVRPPFDHPSIRWIQADLTDASQADKVLNGVNILIQAAATTSGVKDIFTRPHVHVTDNAVMNSYLFRSAYEHKLDHVVFFSCTVMLQSSESALDEQDFDANAELHPRYFGAGWTKVYLEKMCEFYSRLGTTKFTAIRHSNIYGAHDKFDLERSHVFGATITKVMTAKDTVTVWGTGDEERDLLHVDDLANFVDLAIKKQPEKFRLYNCGLGTSISIKDLVNKIVKASGKQLEIKHDLSQPSIKTSLFLDCSLAEKELGWKPQTKLDDGIQRTIDWRIRHQKKMCDEK